MGRAGHSLGVRSQIPREIQLEITNRCNLDCDMCPRLTLLGVPEVDMSRATFEAVLDRLEAPEAITLTGWGEPLMHPELLEFVDSIRARFPAVDLAYAVLERGGVTGSVFIAANEVSRGAFLAGRIPFPAIVATTAQVLERHAAAGPSRSASSPGLAVHEL